jgi:hypothetical protein
VCVLQGSHPAAERACVRGARGGQKSFSTRRFGCTERRRRGGAIGQPAAAERARNRASGVPVGLPRSEGGRSAASRQRQIARTDCDRNRLLRLRLHLLRAHAARDYLAIFSGIVRPDLHARVADERFRGPEPRRPFLGVGLASSSAGGVSVRGRRDWSTLQDMGHGPFPSAASIAGSGTFPSENRVMALGSLPVSRRGVRRGFGPHNSTPEIKLPTDPRVNTESRGPQPRLFSF